MAVIVPAILPTSRRDLEEKLARFVGIAPEVQIDAVDGVFASPASWPYAGSGGELGNGLPFAEHFRIEADLMVKDPAGALGPWIAAGASRILVHLESGADLPRLADELAARYGHEKGFGAELLSFGIAVNVDTDPALLEPHLPRADYVQFMGIKDIGKQGQPFATEVLNRIAVFRRKHPDVPIQVDGGVNMQSAPLLLNAGVSRLIVGSALLRAPDLKRAYEALTELTQSHGIYE